MTQEQVTKKLAEMTRTMEQARLDRLARKRHKIYHQTNPAAWEALKKVMNYEEPR